MNKVVFQVCFLFLLANMMIPLFCRASTSVEFRSSGFYHSSKLFRKIYGNVGGSYQVEVATQVDKFVTGWVNFDWFSKHGRSKGLGNLSRVEIANLSIGIKHPYQFTEKMIGYAGVGLSLARIWLKNQSRCSKEHISKLPGGVLVKVGANYFVTSGLFLDFFVDYLYQPVNFQTRVNIGGVKIGGGVGWQF